MSRATHTLGQTAYPVDIAETMTADELVREIANIERRINIRNRARRAEIRRINTLWRQHNQLAWEGRP